MTTTTEATKLAARLTQMGVLAYRGGTDTAAEIVEIANDTIDLINRLTAPSAVGEDANDVAEQIYSLYEAASDNTCTCNIDENACRYCNAWDSARVKAAGLISAALATAQGDGWRDAIVAAYQAGCHAVHENYQEDRDPDFYEAACDYADSLRSHSGEKK